MRAPLFFLLIILLSCRKSSSQSETPAGFNKTPAVITLKGGALNEASGIADSKINAGYLWVQQDSGNPPFIYLLKKDGTIADSVFINGATNRDWEDMAVSGNDVYIAETGDNNLAYSSYAFYRFAEPAQGTDTVSVFDKIEFTYPDGHHDAEAFLVDPLTKDIYIITKNDVKSKVFVLSFPQNVSGLNEAVYVTDLEFNGVVSAALSSDAKEIIIKTYTDLNYLTKTSSQSIASAFSQSPQKLSYQIEPQGEAVCFGLDGKGFYT
ncbi:MAG: hypothetical protein J7497_03585, partial [Chitinophagaceae bacterium]|nr:hypothetical protein [Chitinophagaceae bacterium]